MGTGSEGDQPEPGKGVSNPLGWDGDQRNVLQTRESRKSF